MSSAHSSPDVYVKELDLSQRIAASSTSIGCVVGASPKGPVMQTTLITGIKEFLDIFGKPNPSISYMHYAALQFLTESKRLYVTRVISADALTAGAYWTVDDVNAVSPITKLTNFDDGSSNPLGVYDPFNTVTFDPAKTGISKVLGFFCVENPGKWNNELMIKIKPSTRAGQKTPEVPTNFWVEVYVNYTSTRQLPDEAFLVSHGFTLDGFGNQMNIEEVINSKSKLIRYRANPYVAKPISILKETSEFFDGGTDGSRVSDSAIKLGWGLYLDPEQIDINILINAGYSSPAVQLYMDDVCQARMDCIAVLDIPSDKQDVSDAMNYKTSTLNLNSSRSAIYSPDLQIYDQYNDRRLFVPPSGFAAAAYARTDYDTATWFAPAGMSRGDLNILGVRKTYNQGSRDSLTMAQINPIRVFPGKGYKIWGADTCQTMASALSNVNVRRLLNFIEKSISIASLYSVFSPNNPVLWAFLREMCERFLTPIKNNQGLYNFSVICDEKNNTPETIALGEVHLDIHLDPVIPAKRISLNATLLRTGTNYKEFAKELSGG